MINSLATLRIAFLDEVASTIFLQISAPRGCPVLSGVQVSLSILPSTTSTSPSGEMEMELTPPARYGSGTNLNPIGNRYYLYVPGKLLNNIEMK